MSHKWLSYRRAPCTEVYLSVGVRLVCISYRREPCVYVSIGAYPVSGRLHYLHALEEFKLMTTNETAYRLPWIWNHASL